MKKPCPTDLLPKLTICLLYPLAAMATVVSGPPTAIIVVTFVMLTASLTSWLLSDNVIDIAALDDNQILLITGQGRWIPGEIATLYYSWLGQVLVFHSLRQGPPWLRKRQYYRLADFLPDDKRLVALREQRCLCLSLLSASMSQNEHQLGKLAGDNTVSSASGNRSGTSMLK